MMELYRKLSKSLTFFVFLILSLSYSSAQAQFISASIKNNGCQIATYSFQEDGTFGGTYNKETWTFGNGNVGFDVAAGSLQEATYDQAGTYFVTVQFITVDGGGVETEAGRGTRTIYVFEQASPEFVGTPRTDCLPMLVDFTDLTDTSSPTIGTVIERKWVFGDGTEYVTNNPAETTTSHTYNNVGDFKVTLVITTQSALANGQAGGNPACTGIKSIPAYIKVRHPATSSFNYTLGSCINGSRQITFNNTSTVPDFPPPAGSIIYSRWTVRPVGSSSTSATIYTGKANYSRSFSVAGDYEVILGTTSAGGCTDFTTTTITIPETDLTVTPTGGALICKDISKSFSAALASANPMGGPVVWDWDIDGTSYNVANPSHTFTAPGTYGINVSASYAGGGCAFASVNVTVNDSPDPDFSPTTREIHCGPFTRTFNAVDNTGGNSYEWRVNGNVVGGNTASLTNFNFTDIGANNVSLKVTNAVGCEFTTVYNDIVNIQPPVAIITPATPPFDGCDGSNFTFEGNTSTSPNDPINNYEWTIIRISDNATVHTQNSATSNTSFTFNLPGVSEEEDYNVFLTVTTTAHSCTASTVRLVQIGATPVPVPAQGATNCFGPANNEAVAFSVSGIDPAWTDVEYTWGALDGAPSAGQGTASATVNFNHPGEKTAFVTVYHNGCETTQFFTAFITGVRANFTPDNACGSATFDFTNTSVEDGFGNPPNVTYLWDFDDNGATSTDVNPTHTFTTVGTRNVSLTATKGSCSQTFVRPIFIQALGENFISVQAGGLCSPSVVDLTAIPSTSAATSWEWYFGNGQTVSRGNSNDFQYTYTTPGTYNIFLTVNQAAGACQTFERQVIVQGPTVDFISVPANAVNSCEDFRVDFTDASANYANLNTNTSWLWEFRNLANNGNLGTHNAQTGAGFTYTAPGDYRVRLTVTDDQGCSATTTKVIHVDPTPQLSVPVADLYCTSDAIQFVNQSTGGGAVYSWEFYNSDGSANITHSGTTPPPVNFVGDGLHFMTLYGNIGTCFTTLTQTVRTITPRVIVKAEGTTEAGFMTVAAITQTDGSTFISAFVNGAPVANTSLDFSCPPGDVRFTADFIDNADGLLHMTGLLWQFGDGDKAFTSVSDHRYLTPGAYLIEMQALTNIGCDAKVPIMTGLVKVEGPIGEFDFTPKEVCYDGEVTFTAFNLRKFKSIEWDFGDGVTSPVTILTDAQIAQAEAGALLPNITQVSHVYTKPGVFYPYLTLNDENDCKISYPSTVGPIYSSGKPNAAFGVLGTAQVCQNLEVSFNDASTEDAVTRSYMNQFDEPYLRPNVVKWSWHYGLNGNGTDGAFITGDIFDFVSDDANNKSETIAFNSAGVYTITLAATTEFGCVSYATQFVTVVKPNITANLNITPAQVCPGGTVTLDGTGSTADIGAGPSAAGLIYIWNFGESGNPATSTEITTVHPDTDQTFVYDKAGVYTVSLTVKDAAGCLESNIATGSVTVTDVRADFDRTPSFGSQPLTVNFTDKSTTNSGTINAWSWQFPEGGPNMATSAAQNPTVTFTSAGVHDVILQVTTDEGCTDILKRRIVVLNNPPIAVNDFMTVNEDGGFMSANAVLGTMISNGTLLITASGADSDPDNHGLVLFNTVGFTSAGVITQQSDGTFTYLPNTNFAGLDQFNYRIWDDFVYNAATGLDNLPPVALNDTYNAVINTTLTVNSSGDGLLQQGRNDYDPEGSDLDLFKNSGNNFITSTRKGGFITVNGNNGQFTYNPPAGFTGLDFVDYSIRADNDPGTFTTARAYFVVNNSANRPPVPTPETLTTTYQTPTTGSFSATDPDAGNSVVFTPVTAAPTENGGVISVSSSGAYTYTMPKNYSGPITDYYVYTVCDNQNPALCAQSTMTITVNPSGGNLAPRPVTNYYNATSGTTLTVPDGGTDLTSNDIEPDGDAMSPNYKKDINGVDINRTDYGGFVTVYPDGSFNYNPPIGFTNVTDRFVYQVCDPFLSCTEATAYFNLDPPGGNRPPVASNSAFTTASGATITVNIAGGAYGNHTDPDGDFMTVRSVFQAVTESGGYITLAGDGTMTYKAPTGVNGTIKDYYIYKVCDNNAAGSLCDEAMIEFTITPGNNAPVPAADYALSTVNTPFTGASLTANDTEPDGHTMVAANRKTVDGVFITATSKGGTIFVSANGTYNYYPPKDFIGEDAYIYEVCDNQTPAECGRNTLKIKVSADNQAPVANQHTITVNSFTTVTGTLTGQTSDPNGNTLTFTSVYERTATDGLIKINTDGTYSYVPGFESNGYNFDHHPYTVCDNGNPELCSQGLIFITVTDAALPNLPTAMQSNFATVNIFVSAANDPAPLLADDQEITKQGVPIAFTTSVLVNDQSFERYLPDAGSQSSLFYTAPFLTVTENATVFATINVLGTNAGNGQGFITVNENGHGSYNPDPGFYGIIEFEYKAWDDGNGSTPEFSTASIFITVNGPPAPTDDNFAIAVGTNFASANAINGGTLSAGIYIQGTNTSDTDLYLGSIVTGVQAVGTSTAPVASNGGKGNYFILPNGNFGYTPTPGQTGPDWFAYELCDDVAAPNQMCTFATVNIMINDYPAPQDDNDITLENVTIDSKIPATAFITSVLINDTDPNTGNSLTVKANTFTTIPGTFTTVSLNGGLVMISADGHYSYLPQTGYNGNDQFFYEACDDSPAKLCAFATVFITVNGIPTPQNDLIPPIAQDQTYFASAVGIFITANDTDPFMSAGFTVTPQLAFTSSATGGTYIMNTDGSFEYRPTTGFYGPDYIVYQLCDNVAAPNTGCQFATVFLTVNGIPIANDDYYIGSEDTPIFGTAIYNDSDPEGVNTTANQLAPASNGSVVFNPDGTFVYTPNLNFTGNDQFTYRICDNLGQCDFATVFISIAPVNDAPVAFDDVNTTPENTTLTVLAGSADALGADHDDPVIPGDTPGDDYDPDGNGDPANDTDLTFSTVTDAVTRFGGKITIDAGGGYVYNPAAGFTGVDEYQYEVCDEQSPVQCVRATLFITVTPVDEIVAINDQNSTTVNTPITGASSLFANDYDPEGTVLARVGNADMAGGTPTGNGTIFISADGTYTYVPNNNFTGTDTYIYTVADKLGGGGHITTTATLTIVVTPQAGGQRPPVARNDYEQTLRNVPVKGTVIRNDSDPDGDPITVSTAPFTTVTQKGGTLEMDPAGNFTYTPANNFVGTDASPYTICDPGGLCASATLFLTVTHANEPPTPVNDYYAGKQNGFLTANVKINDNDPDATDIYSVLTIQGVTNGTTTYGGFISVGPDGTFNYAPKAGFTGTDSYIYTICDDELPVNACTQATLFISVAPVNQPPVALNDLDFTSVNTPLTSAPGVTILGNDFDPDNDPIAMTSVGTFPTNVGGSITINADGSYSYTPPTGFIGTDLFPYQICDQPHNQCANAMLKIIVGGSNKPPVAINDENTTTEDTPVTATVANGLLSNDSDPNVPGTGPAGDDVAGHFISAGYGPAGTATMKGGSISFTSTGIYTYTPPANFNGTDYYVYKICDNGNPVLCAEAFLTVTITPVNDPPIARHNNDETNKNVAIVQNNPNLGVLPNDFDADNTLSVTIAAGVPTTQGGKLFLSADGTYRYEPPTGFVGDDTYEYTVFENGEAVPQFATATLFITVHPVNLPPVAVNDEIETSEDTPVTGITVAYNDSDPEGEPLTVNQTPVTQTKNGGVVIHPDGTYTYTPNPGFNGTDDFMYEVCDPGGKCAIATVFITVHPINDAPVAYDDIYTTAENTTLTVNAATGILARVDGAPVNEPAGANPDDRDPDGANDDDTDLTVSAVTNAGTNFGGKITIATDGSFVYTPANGFNGVDFYQYEVCDVQNPTQCTNATVFITVTPTDNIVAVNDQNSTTVNTPITGASSLFANDYDPEGTVLARVANADMAGGTATANGTIFISADGTYTYVPNNNFVGTDTYVYTVADKLGGAGHITTTATLTIVITPEAGGQRPPVARNDYEQTLRNVPIISTVIRNDNDPDGDPITVSTAPFTTVTGKGGTLEMAPDGTFTYTPANNFVGNDAHPYTICDPGGLCASATLFITVTHGNEPPTPINDYYYTNQNSFLTANVKLNDTDPDATDTYNALTINGVQNGTTTYGGFISVGPDGTFNYQPKAGFVGTDSYIYTICDDENPAAACTPATLFISVVPINHAPVAVNDIAFTSVNTSVTGDDTVFGKIKNNDYDPDGDPITVTPVTNVTTTNGGKLTIAPDGTYTYTPAPGFVSADTYEYQICDDKGACAKAILTIIVINAPNNNLPPVALNDENTTAEDTPITVAAGDPKRLMVNDSDPNIPAGVNNIPGHFISAGYGQTGQNTEKGGFITITDPATGAYSYTPPANFHGTDYYVYKICDSGNPVLCAEAFLTVTITPVNDPPIARDNNDETNKNVAIVQNNPNLGVLPNDFDADNTLSVTIAAGVPTTQGGKLFLSADGTYRYEPPTGFVGDDTYEYTVFENGEAVPQFATATLFITVHPVNLPPVAVNDEIETSEDTPVTGITVAYNDSDPEGEPLTVNQTPVTQTKNGGVVIHPDGTYTYTPNPGFNGTDDFMYEVCDPGGKCAIATVFITVHPINDAPVAFDDIYTTPENTTLTVNAATGILARVDGAPVNEPAGANPDDRDPDGANDDDTDLTVSTVTNAVTNFGGKITIAADGSFVYTPANGFNGTDFYQYEVCDVQNPTQCTNATVFITVTGVDQIVARNDVDYAKPGQTITGLQSLFANDYDPEGTVLKTPGNAPINGINTPKGTLNIAADGTYTYTADPGTSGTDTYTYTVQDANGTGITTTAVLTIYISEIDNRPPVALDDYRTTPRNVPIDGTVIFNDTDPDGDEITVSTTPFTTVTANGGSLFMTANGTYVYTPANNFVGVDYQSYTICDPFTSCATATLFISVIHANEAPTPVNDFAYTNENAFLTGNVKLNDSDPDATDTYAVLGINPVVNAFTTFGGQISIDASGNFSYTPRKGFTGTDQYNYTICDDESPTQACTPATLFISVVPVNHAPIAVNDFAFTSVNQPVTGDGTTFPKLKLNDIDPDGDPLTVTPVTDKPTPNGGKITIGTDGTYTYTPPVGYIGTDTYEYQVCDDKGECAKAKLTIVIGSQNLPPVAINDGNTTTEDTPITVGDADPKRLLANDTDPNIPGVGTAADDIPGHFISAGYGETGQVTEKGGTITITNPATGAYTYTPAPGFNGTDIYVYKICDNGNPQLCAEAFLTITIPATNSKPVAFDDYDETNEDERITVTDPNRGVLPNDLDADNPLTVTPANDVLTNKGGKLTLAADGTYTYDPPAGFNGPDWYQYTVCEKAPGNQCDTATLFITVLPVNDLPIARNDKIATSEDVPVTGGDVRLNDGDPEGGILTIETTPVVPPRNGTVVIRPDGTYTYTPNPGFNGKDDFVYRVCEPDGDCAIATVLITVHPVNDKPLAFNDINTTPENTTLNVTDPALGILGDVDGAPVNEPAGNPNEDDRDPDGANNDDTDLTVSPVTNATTTFGGQITLNADGTYSYTPARGFNGTDNYTYTVCDVQNPTQCTQAILFITVTPTNNGIVALNDYASTSVDVPFAGVYSLFSNDYDPEGKAPLHTNSFTSIGGPTANVGTIQIAPNGNYYYTPPAGFTGVDNYQYTVFDQDGLSTTAFLTVYIGNVASRPPQANPDHRTTYENMPVIGTLLSNDSDPEAKPIAATPQTLITTEQGGKLTIKPDGTYTYYPPNNFTGNDQYVYTVCQTVAPNLCATSTLFLTVLPQNEPPIPLDESVTTNVNAFVTGNVKLNDSDPDPTDTYAVLKVGPVTDAPTVSGGIITLDTDGNFTYTPPKGFVGNDSYRYLICDDESPDPACKSATLFITVVQKNNPPMAQNDYAFTTVNVPVTGSTSAVNNDFDPDGDPIAITPVTDAPTVNGGKITIDANGIYTYTPPFGFKGVDFYTYTLCENGGANVCVQAKIVITVGGTNQPPVALPDNNTTPEDTPVGGVVKTNDSDPDDAPGALTVTAVTNAVTERGGKITIDANGNYTYTPAPNFNGNDTYLYTICDDEAPVAACAQALVYITVTPVIDGPLAVSDTNRTLKNVPLVVDDPYFGVIRNDSHSEHRPLTITPFTSVTTPKGGNLTMYPDGTYVYYPDPYFVGTDEYPYQVCDDNAPPQCTNATLFITVIELLNAPETTGEHIFVGQDTPYTETVSLLNNDNDPEGGPLTINPVPVVNPRHGTLVINPDGTFTYTPAPGYYGTDSFVYQVCDKDGDCSTATVTILVNAKPIAEDDSEKTIEDKPITSTVMPNDNDPDNNNLTAKVTGQPANGSVSMNPDGTYTYTPKPGYYGPDQFEYEICDDGIPVLCDKAIVRIYVNGKPDLVNDTGNVGQDGILTGTTILVNDSEPEGHGMVLNTSPTIPPINGKVTINPDGTYVYIPKPGYYGNDSFVYEVCDDFNPVACDTARVFITVNAKPIAVDDQATTKSNTPVFITAPITKNDYDPDGNNLILNPVPITLPPNGTIVINPDGTALYTPNPGFRGVDSLTYAICDDGIPSLCDTATVFITVIGGPPIAIDDHNQVPHNAGSVGGNVIDNDINPRAELTLSVTLVTPPNNGQVVLNSDGTYTYTPTTDFVGTDQFTYQLCNNDSPPECDFATVFIKVLNSPPTAETDSLFLTAGSTVSSTVSPNDKDPDNDKLTYKLVTPPTHGTVTINPDGTYTYTPKPGHYGNDVFFYEVCDPYGECVIEKVVVTITQKGIPEFKPEDTVLGSFGDSLTTGKLDYEQTQSGKYPTAGGGIFTVNPDGTYSYISGPCYSGLDSVSITVCRTVPAACSQVTVYMNVQPGVYGAPVVNPIQVGVESGEDFSGSLLEGHPDRDILTVRRLDPITEEGGSFDIDADGNFTYRHADRFAGTDRVMVEICYNESYRYAGCSPCDTTFIYFNVAEGEFIPEGFSPNGDGVNDTFNVPDRPGARIISLSIFNRWGNLVYESEDYRNDWNGSANRGKVIGGNGLPAGTYFYLLDFHDGKKPVFGFLELRR